MEEEQKQKIRSRTIIEIMGKPKEHVESAMKMFLNKIKDDDNGVVLLKENVKDIKEDKEKGFFSTFAELEMITKDLPALIGFCFDYMPSSIEILAPEQMVMKQNDLSNVMNDLQAKLHMVDMAVKTTKSENDFLKRNINTVLRNLVLVSLTHKAMKMDDISKVTGVQEKELKVFLESLVKLSKIKEEDGVYSLK